MSSLAQIKDIDPKLEENAGKFMIAEEERFHLKAPMEAGTSYTYTFQMDEEVFKQARQRILI